MKTKRKEICCNCDHRLKHHALDNYVCLVPNCDCEKFQENKLFKTKEIFRIGDFILEKQLNHLKQPIIYISRTSGEGMETSEAKFIAAIEKFYDKYF